MGENEKKSMPKHNRDVLYSMSLHQHTTFTYSNEMTLSITRVPGGWLYNGTFVTFDNEFMRPIHREGAEL